MNTITAESPLMVSNPRRLSQREFLMTLGRLKCRVPLTLLGMVAIGLILCGIFLDLRWLIAALMLIAIVMPGIMIFLYFTYALSPRCLPCVHDHHIELYSDELRIIYSVAVPGDEDAAPELRQITVSVPLSDIDSCRPGLNELTLTMRRPFGLLKLRYADLPDAQKFIDLLRNR